MKYDKDKIWNINNKNLDQAITKLKEIDLYDNGEIEIKGLSGWIFELTIKACIKSELEDLELECEITEQYKLNKYKIDLKINDKILIELKKGGSPLEGLKKYKKIRELGNEMGFIYLYFTGSESSPKAIAKTKEIFGIENSFFMDKLDWDKFITRITNILAE